MYIRCEDVKYTNAKQSNIIIYTDPISFPTDVSDVFSSYGWFLMPEYRSSSRHLLTMHTIRPQCPDANAMNIHKNIKQ